MKCPICQTTDLLTAERAGIQVDTCPNCLGMWLDRDDLLDLLKRGQRAGEATPLQPKDSFHRFRRVHDGEFASSVSDTYRS